MGLGGLLGAIFTGGRYGPPPAPLPLDNPKPDAWSDGHARNVAYKYREEVKGMYRGRPSWRDYAGRWDNQPQGSPGCHCSACNGR
jgi:hypothetical protein